MTVLTGWEPFRQSATMQDRMNVMNRLLRESYSPEGPEEALTTTNYAPPVDIYGGEHNTPLKLEVPGLPTFPRASQQPNSLTPTLVTWIAGVGRRAAAQSTSEKKWTPAQVENVAHPLSRFCQI
jgi:hypothetical protein